MFTSLVPDSLSPAWPCCLSVCSTGAREPQGIRACWRDKGVADSTGNQYSTYICK